MATHNLQVILFPEDDTTPRLVPLQFKLEKRHDRPGVFPSACSEGEIERVLADGRADLPDLMNCEYHMISPRLIDVDSDQIYCAFTPLFVQPCILSSRPYIER
jgi:hypothetical protein